MIQKLYGVCCDFAPVPAFKKKFIINSYVTKVANKPNTFIISGLCAQKSLKAFCNAVLTLENVEGIKTPEVHIYGAKPITEKKKGSKTASNFTPVLKAKTYKKTECVCGE